MNCEGALSALDGLEGEVPCSLGVSLITQRGVGDAKLRMKNRTLD